MRRVSMAQFDHADMGHLMRTYDHGMRNMSATNTSFKRQHAITSGWDVAYGEESFPAATGDPDKF